MSSKTKNREVAYTRAIQICQNLARLTVYELIGNQILLPKEEEGTALRPSPLVLLPVVDEPSAGAVEAVAKIGTTFVAVKSTLDPAGNQKIEFTVLAPKNGKTTRHGNLRAWSDGNHRIFLGWTKPISNAVWRWRGRCSSQPMGSVPIHGTAEPVREQVLGGKAE